MQLTKAGVSWSWRALGTSRRKPDQPSLRRPRPITSSTLTSPKTGTVRKKWETRRSSGLERFLDSSFSFSFISSNVQSIVIKNPPSYISLILTAAFLALLLWSQQGKAWPSMAFHLFMQLRSLAMCQRFKMVEINIRLSYSTCLHETGTVETQACTTFL